MDLTEGSETSANIKQTLGKHLKVNTVNTEHSESLKSRNLSLFTCSICSKPDLLYHVEAVILTAQFNATSAAGFVAYIIFKRGFAFI
jgi:hypothetical protein